MQPAAAPIRNPSSLSHRNDRPLVGRSRRGCAFSLAMWRSTLVVVKPITRLPTDTAARAPRQPSAAATEGTVKPPNNDDSGTPACFQPSVAPRCPGANAVTMTRLVAGLESESAAPPMATATNMTSSVGATASTRNPNDATTTMSMAAHRARGGRRRRLRVVRAATPRYTPLPAARLSGAQTGLRPVTRTVPGRRSLWSSRSR